MEVRIKRLKELALQLAYESALIRNKAHSLAERGLQLEKELKRLLEELK